MACLHDSETITVVPSVAPYYAEAAVAIVPLRIGGGARLKILEAFAFRVPVVSTSIGWEGLAVESGRHLLVADRPRAFAEACVALLHDASLADHLAGHAAALVASRYAWDTIENDMAAMLRGVLTEGQPTRRPLVPTSGRPGDSVT